MTSSRLRRSRRRTRSQEKPCLCRMCRDPNRRPHRPHTKLNGEAYRELRGWRNHAGTSRPALPWRQLTLGPASHPSLHAQAGGVVVSWATTQLPWPKHSGNMVPSKQYAVPVWCRYVSCIQCRAYTEASAGPYVYRRRHRPNRRRTWCSDRSCRWSRSHTRPTGSEAMRHTFQRGWSNLRPSSHPRKRSVEGRATPRRTRSQSTASLSESKWLQASKPQSAVSIVGLSEVT
jgi:hypothetical protein